MHFEGVLVRNPDQTAADILANGQSYRPEIRMKMYMTLWNPYNVPISLARNENVGDATWPNFRGGGTSDARNRMQISMINQHLENFEIEIDGESWVLGKKVDNDPSSGDYETLFPGTGINIRYPLAIADVRFPRRFSDDADHPERLGGNPHQISDYEAGEVRFFSFHSKERDATGDDGEQPGEATAFFVSLDDVGYQAWQNTFRKKLGFWDDPNSGYKAGDVVNFHFKIGDTTETSGLQSILNAYSSNSGNVQRPAQVLTTEMDFSVQPLAEPIQAGVLDAGTGDPVVVDLGYIEFVMKSGNDTHPKDYSSSMDFPVPRFTNFNPRGFAGSDENTPYTDGQNPLYWFGTVRNGDPINHISTVRAGGPRDSNQYHRGYFGEDHTSSSGQTNLAFFDIPRRPVESMGQYQHAMLSWLSHQPTYPFGNSLADIHVPRSGVIARYSDNGSTTSYMDYSWFVNDALWDDYFLSTIDPYVDSNTVRLRPQRGRFVELDQNAVYNRGDSVSPDDKVDYSESAGNLLLRGAFNVNSTSVEAWKTVIASASNDGIPYLDPEDGFLDETGTKTGSLTHGYYRLSVPIGEEDVAWTGGPRDLTDSEVTSLAESIVEQVKSRGPFLSISDFVNRRIGPDSDDRTMMGAIQAAIEDQGAALQDNLVPNVGQVTFSSGEPLYWEDNLPQSVIDKPLAFAPGDLTQADILTSIAPLLTARSDTFMIRSMGSKEESEDADAISTAWVEMLVQRMPQAVDADQDDLYTTGPFGREFKIISMRYLDEEDI
jgi:hypothetical protein